MEVGHLERIDNETRPTVYMGQIAMQGAQGDIALIPRRDRRSDRSPDFDVKIIAPGRDWMIAGAAWIKPFKDGSGAFFSLTIDHPGLSQPIYVSAFPDDAEKQPKEAEHPINYSIVWGRPRRNGPVAADPVMASDSIPY